MIYIIFSEISFSQVSYCWNISFWFGDHLVKILLLCLCWGLFNISKLPSEHLMFIVYVNTLFYLGFINISNLFAQNNRFWHNPYWSIHCILQNLKLCFENSRVTNQSFRRYFFWLKLYKNVKQFLYNFHFIIKTIFRLKSIDYVYANGYFVNTILQTNRFFRSFKQDAWYL